MVLGRRRDFRQAEPWKVSCSKESWWVEEEGVEQIQE